MTDIIYTPFDLSAPVKAGRHKFWKQVLPVTKIDYKGQKVNFDPNFHMDLTKSFEQKAFDQVPVVFADGENRHNMDPRNFGGDVLKMEYRGSGPDQGTWALIEADKDAAKAIQRNPKLGVSARIRQMIEKADGRKFPRAVEHICLTMNPRVTGMGPWQAVDLSEEDADIEVVDLTAVDYKEGKPMGKTATKSRSSASKSSKGSKIDLSALDDDQFATLLDLAQTALADPDAEVDEEEDPEDLEVEDPSPTRKRRKKSKTKVTVEKDSEEDPGDEDEDEEDEEDEEVELSDADRASGREALSQVTRVRLDLAEQRWNTERERYLANGVPAFLVDLAEPVLSLPDPLTIDLADDETIDATDTIRQMLDGVKGVIDLAGELGHQIDLTGNEEDEETDAFLEAWDEQYG